MSDIILHIGEYTMSIGSDADHNNLNGRDASDCHPISAIIGLQDELNKNARQVYEQLSPSVVWTITHNLGDIPTVLIIDSSTGEKVEMAVILTTTTCVASVNTAPAIGTNYTVILLG